MNRKLTFLILICLFISNLICPWAAKADDTESSQPGEPLILIANDSWLPEYKAGEKVNLSIPIENVGSASAENVNISLAVSDPDKFPFKTEKMSFNCHITSFSPGSTNASFNATIPPDVKPGTYPITVNVSYTTPSGTSGQASGTIYVKITNSYKQPLLQCSGVKFDGENLYAGKSTVINLQMQNDGDLALEDIELQLGGFSANGISLDKWSDTQNIRNMAAGETKLIAYKILVDPEVKSGTYTLDLSMKYKDEYNQDYTRASKVYLPVAGKDAQDDVTPRIILENYTVDTPMVIPGNAFPLNLSFVNTSETQQVNNIKISLNSDGQVFSPVGSSNSFYIAKLGAGNTFQKVLVLMPKTTAESQVYNINVDIDYQDSKGTKLNEKELISIPVNQEAKFVLAGVEVPSDVAMETPQSISVNYHNGGKAVIRNLSIKVTGDFEVKDGDQYLGNLESGKNDYCDITVIAHKTGQLAGKVMMAYDDDSGKHYQQSKDFQVRAIKQPEPQMPGPAVPVGTKKPLWKKWIIPAAGVAAAAVVAAIVWRKRKHAKEEVDFEDE